MSWDQATTDAIANQNAATIRQNLQALPYYQELATRGISSGADQIVRAKAAIDAALNDIRSETANRKAMIRDIADQTTHSDVASLNNHIRFLTPQVEQQNALVQLRTEQATALANKYASNYYSSWWELWFPVGLAKPLSESTRVLVYVAAAGLAVTAGVLGSGVGSAPGGAGIQEGGRRKKRTSV